MYPIIVLTGLFALLNSSMAIGLGGSSNKNTNRLHNLYLHMREHAVRFMFHHHYHVLKNEQLRENINNIISKYYDTVYHYSNLSDEELDFIEAITSLVL